MPTAVQEAYQARHWPSLSGLQGISDHTMTVHFGLYEGYVKNTNLLNEELAEAMERGEESGAEPRFAELKRRLGFEYNGMRLHELYFEGMTASPATNVPSTVKEALARGSGDFERWKNDFVAVGGMRGVGWAIAYRDPATSRVTNHWIGGHQDGHIAGFEPIVVMDAWEHAFLFDYKPAERGKYIEAFFANIDWMRVESRLGAARSSR
jgi:Fe-Mn family superoxide dismutase